MTHKTLNAWGARSLRSCLISLLIAAIVVPLGGVCVLLPLYVVQTGDFDNTTTFLIVVIPMMGFVLLILGGSIGFAAWMFLSRKRQLDGAFIPLGLTGGMYLLNGRQYHGTVSARRRKPRPAPADRGGLRAGAHHADKPQRLTAAGAWRCVRYVVRIVAVRRCAGGGDATESVAVKFLFPISV